MTCQLEFDINKGITCDRADSREKNTIVVIVYDHEAKAMTDTMMEVGIGEDTKEQSFLLKDFSRIRSEGLQNHPSPATSSVQFFHQLESDLEIMANVESLNNFSIEEEEFDIVKNEQKNTTHAKVVSKKNFQLVRTKPTDLSLKESFPLDEQESKKFQLQSMSAALRSCSATSDGLQRLKHTFGRIAYGRGDDLGIEGEGQEDVQIIVNLQMGKLDVDLFDCLYRPDTFSMLQAFCTCLSRFETSAPMDTKLSTAFSKMGLS